MKHLFPLALVLLLAACETVPPEEPQARHQRRLSEEARENFIRERQLARERSGRTAPAPVTSEGREIALQPFAPRQRPRSSSRAVVQDTIYEPTEDGRAEQRAWELRQALDYRAFESREARRLGKHPSQLTPQERAWIRSMF